MIARKVRRTRIGRLLYAIDLAGLAVCVKNCTNWLKPWSWDRFDSAKVSAGGGPPLFDRPRSADGLRVRNISDGVELGALTGSG
jgi:hypothetical protein